MFSSISSMSSSMTTSLQLAKDCLESEKVETTKTEQIEGVQKFAHMIDSGTLSFQGSNLICLTTCNLSIV